MIEQKRNRLWAPIDQHTLDRKEKALKVGGYLGMVMAVVLVVTLASARLDELLQLLVGAFAGVSFFVMAYLATESGRGLSEDALRGFDRVERERTQAEIQAAL